MYVLYIILFYFITLHYYITGPIVFSQSLSIILSVFLISYFGDLLLLMPTLLFIQFACIDALLYITLHKLKRVIIARSKYILHRPYGLFDVRSMFLQHYNPACRAARMYPNCSASLLLMQVRDHDYPVTFPYYRYFQVQYWLNLAFTCIEIILSYSRLIKTKKIAVCININIIIIIF